MLDNTYLTRASRSYVVETASRHGIATRCVWLDTPLADAQVNLVERLLDDLGALPAPEELRQLARNQAACSRPPRRCARSASSSPPRPMRGSPRSRRGRSSASPRAAGCAPASSSPRRAQARRLAARDRGRRSRIAAPAFRLEPGRNPGSAGTPDSPGIRGPSQAPLNQRCARIPVGHRSAGAGHRSRDCRSRSRAPTISTRRARS